MNYSVIVLCAGVGSRTGLKYNKMFYQLKDGQTVYQKTMSVFIQDQRCLQIIVVCKKEEEEDFQHAIQDERIEFVEGGKERQDSVYNGLQKVKEDYVFIHDGARPYLKTKAIDDLLLALKDNQGCLLMVPCKDTIKVVEDGQVKETLPRASLMQAQTPQAFHSALIKACYQKAKDTNYQATDDSSLVEVFGQCPMKAVLGDYENMKITTKEDLS